MGCPATGQLLGIEHVDSVVAAQRVCDSLPQCDFFSWDVPEQQATLCSGHEADFIRRPGYYTTFDVDSIVGVRPRGLQAKGYEVLTNYQMVCEPGQVLGEVRGVFTMDEAARRCDADPQCHFFGLSTSSTHAHLANTLWLCKGEPVFASRYGWLGAGKTRWMPPRVPGQDGLPNPIPAGSKDGAGQPPLLLESSTQPTPMRMASFLCIDHNVTHTHSRRQIINSFFADTTTQQQLQANAGEGTLPPPQGFTFSRARYPVPAPVPDDADAELRGQLRARDLERKMNVNIDDL